MGKSNGIEEKEKADAEFRKFMDNVRTEAEKQEAAIQTDIDALVKKHYETNGWDHARLFGNRQSDYQNYDDWSMDRITAIANSIGQALKGGNFPSPKVPGSDKATTETVEQAKEFIGGFMGDYDLIIARVLAMISAVLAQFSVASNAAQKTVFKDMPLSGGLHLFFGSNGSVYTNNTFFTNQYIGSFQIVFETYMSVKEAQAIGLQQILVSTQLELDTLNRRIAKLLIAQEASLDKIIDNKPEDYLSTSAVYQKSIDSLKALRDTVFEKYNKYNSTVKTVDKVFDKLEGNSTGGTLKLETLFAGQHLDIAQRYTQEKLQSQKAIASAAA